MTGADDRTGVLVVKAWLEHERPPLRVRITERLDLQSSDERTTAVAGAEAAAGIVRDWLLTLESAGGARREPPDETTIDPRRDAG